MKKEFKYWVVEQVYCFDTCVCTQATYNFTTKEKALEYYNNNVNKQSGDLSLHYPEEKKIEFEE